MHYQNQADTYSISLLRKLYQGNCSKGFRSLKRKILDCQMIMAETMQFRLLHQMRSQTNVFLCIFYIFFSCPQAFSEL